MDNVAQYLQMMDVSGADPTMQNIGSQSALQQQNMAAMKSLGQQALGDKQVSPFQSLADALRKGTQNKPGLGQMLDDKGNIVYDPKYGNINQSSVMQNPTYNPYENPI